MDDALNTLRDAGLPVDQLSAAQRAVLAALDEHETAVLVSIQERLHQADGDVVAHDLKML